MTTNGSHVTESQWGTFPGGELEGRRPKALCPACRERLRLAAATGKPVSGVLPPRHLRGDALRQGSRPLCFQCYRAELERTRALAAAGQLDTASPERFQFALPLEPINVPRLEMLKVERTSARSVVAQGAGQFEEKRRHAQIAARHALQQIAAGVMARRLTPAERGRAMAWGIHAAELQLPESWLPFVVSR